MSPLTTVGALRPCFVASCLMIVVGYGMLSTALADCIPPTCDDGNVCTDDLCDPALGCVHTDNAVLCDDGNACTSGDVCREGECLGIDLLDCSDGDACTEDLCDPATAVCSHNAMSDGARCNDGDGCTRRDECAAGVCEGLDPVGCVAADQCHDEGVCQPATGVCTTPVKTDGQPCDDTNACTRSDTCQAGACVGTDPVVCTALNTCHFAGACDPATGLCSQPAWPNGRACDDGNAGTRYDSCSCGTCVGSSVQIPAISPVGMLFMIVLLLVAGFLVIGARARRGACP